MNDEPRRETILVVDDDGPMRRTLRGLLESRSFAVLDRASAEDALEALQSEPVDLVITDLRMPGMKGEALLREIRATFPQLPVIAITAFGSVDAALELTRSGAADYLEKPFRTQRVLESIDRALEQSAPAREHARARSGTAGYLHEMVGASPSMLELFGRIARVGRSPAPVLITGETGTGKELVARAVHEASGRTPFLAVNCGAIPQHILESELFGHAKGSFTGATSDKRGLFEAASGGTLFLDEIGELPLSLQPKLLRAIESGEIRRVGEVESRRVDLRIVAATHRDLAAAVEEQQFREDLFWRLRVLHLEIPPLRERASDIPLLVDVFLERLGARAGREGIRVTRDALDALVRYAWPGNIRQLRNTLEAALTFGRGDEIGLDDVPAEIRRAGVNRGIVVGAADRELTLAELEKEYIFEMLRRTNGNKSRASDLLGIPRRTLYRRLEQYAAESAVPAWTDGGEE
jgi:two-component system, NtrC family, response regulator AtoC